MACVFNQIELDWDGKRFLMDFSELFVCVCVLWFVFFFNVLNSKRWGQRMIILESHMPSRVLHCLQETLLLLAKFFSYWTLKAYSALVNICSSLWCNWVFVKIIRKFRARCSHNWKELKKNKRRKQATEMYGNWSTECCRRDERFKEWWMVLGRGINIYMSLVPGVLLKVLTTI